MKLFKSLFMASLVAIAGVSLISCQENAKADAGEKVTPNTAKTIEVNQPNTPNTPTVAAGPTTTIKFDETTFDFGTVDQGDKVQHTYKFTNTGKESLIISNAKGSCGCTVPSWPKEPIAPGKSGEILVEFDTKGKKNNQNKTVTITANTTPAQTFLKIKGVVNAPDVKAAPVKKK